MIGSGNHKINRISKETYLSFKVDVDTYIGLKKGVPALLELFYRFGILSTFFVSFGPDNSGKAIRRIFTKNGFLRKMVRTNAVGIYGFPTLLYGTLLPAPMIAESFPFIMREIEKKGHEVGMHGYNHVQWHDFLDEMEDYEISDWIQRGVSSFQSILSHTPVGFAAPGWKINNKGLTILNKYNFLYQSNTRGMYPFFPCIDGTAFNILEIPTTMPTLDEIIGNDFTDDRLITFLLDKLQEGVINVMTIHAEVEGMKRLEFFRNFLNILISKNIKFYRLCDIAEDLLQKRESIPSNNIFFDEIAGRAGKVAIQMII